jgi:hypothetical protein
MENVQFMAWYYFTHMYIASLFSMYLEGKIEFVLAIFASM